MDSRVSGCRYLLLYLRVVYERSIRKNTMTYQTSDEIREGFEKESAPGELFILGLALGFMLGLFAPIIFSTITS